MSKNIVDYEDNCSNYSDTTSEYSKENFKRYHGKSDGLSKTEEENFEEIYNKQRNILETISRKRKFNEVSQEIYLNKVKRQKCYEWLKEEEIKIKNLLQERFEIEEEIYQENIKKWEEKFAKEETIEKAKEKVEEMIKEEIERTNIFKEQIIEDRNSLYEGVIKECIDIITENMGKEELEISKKSYKFRTKRKETIKRN